MRTLEDLINGTTDFKIIRKISKEMWDSDSIIQVLYHCDDWKIHNDFCNLTVETRDKIFKIVEKFYYELKKINITMCANMVELYVRYIMEHPKEYKLKLEQKI